MERHAIVNKKAMNGGSPMKEAIVVPVTGQVDWTQVPVIPIDEQMSQGELTASAYAQICYDDNALYVHLSETSQEVRIVEEGPLAMPCHDSCLEFFFCPMEDELRYINLEFNAKPALYMGIGSGIHDLTRLVFHRSTEFQDLLNPVAEVREDGWDLTFRMPYSFVRRFFPDFAVTPGRTMRANFYKTGDKLEKPTSLAWNRIYATKPARFHTPEEFGKLTFQ